MDAGLRDGDAGPPPLRALELESGTILNGIYRLDRFLTRGGMGEVYVGSNVETEEQVAVKVMLPRLAADPKVLALFRSEARLLIRVAHPALVQYRVFARDAAHDVHYLVTDFIDGDPLSARFGSERPEAQQVARLVRRLAGGLAVTHAIGAVHRDMSPDNVLLPGGSIDQAKIIDFGIAKYVEPQDRTVVVEGFAGKLGYVAPEQFGLFGSRIGPWTDIYSTGLVALAFARSAPIDMGRTVADAVEKRAAVPDLTGVCDSLQPLLRAMLEPDPAHRIGSMEAVAGLLDAPVVIRDAAPQMRELSHPSVSAPARSRAGWRAIAAVCALSVSAVLALWLAQPASSGKTTLSGGEAAPAPTVAVPATARPSRAAPLPPPPGGDRQAVPPVAADVTNPAVLAPPPGDGPSIAAAFAPHGRASRVCLSGGGVPTVVRVQRLAPMRPAALLYIAPGGTTRALWGRDVRFGGSPPPAASVRPLGKVGYRVSLCAEPGSSRYALIDGASSVPVLSGSSSDAVEHSYRNLAGRRGLSVRFGRVDVATRVQKRTASASVYAARPDAVLAPVAVADRPASVPASRADTARLVQPEVAFCRRYRGGRWRDIGLRSRKDCIAAAFSTVGSGHAQYGTSLLRRYKRKVEVQVGGTWRALTEGGGL